MNHSSALATVPPLLLIVSGCAASDEYVRWEATRLEANKQLVRRYYEHVVSSGDVAAVELYISPDYVYVHEGVRHDLGIEGEKEHVLGVRRTYPDLRLTVERKIAEGDWVATVVKARGTHRGVWLGMKSTNKAIEVTAVNVDRVVDGRIVEHNGAANLLEPLLGIGAIRIAEPVPDDAGAE